MTIKKYNKFNVNVIDSSSKDVFINLEVDTEWFNKISNCFRWRNNDKVLKGSPNTFVTVQVGLMGGAKHHTRPLGEAATQTWPEGALGLRSSLQRPLRADSPQRGQGEAAAQTGAKHQVIFEHPDLRKAFPDHYPKLQTWDGETGLADILNRLIPSGGPYTLKTIEHFGTSEDARKFSPALRSNAAKRAAKLAAKQAASALQGVKQASNKAAKKGAKGAGLKGEGAKQAALQAARDTKSAMKQVIRKAKKGAKLASAAAQAAKRPDMPHFGYFNLEINCFYSFADIVGLIGRKLGTFIADNMLTGKQLRTKEHRLKIPLIITDGFGRSRPVRVKITDWFGIENTSLDNTCMTYSVDMQYKHLMNDYKTRMNEAYMNPATHNDFIKYAKADLCLHKLKVAYRKSYEWLCGLVGIKERDSRYPPKTKGAKVARMFVRLLDQLFPVGKDFANVLDIPQGKEPSIRYLIRQYGVSELINSDPSLTTRHLAIVLGGRIQHEVPGLSVLRDVLLLSMDLVSCYGTALVHMGLPIGHPLLFYYPKHHTQDWPALGQWLHKWEDELVPGCWYAIIDTLDKQLSFSQNIIFSKLIGRADKPKLREDAKLHDDFKHDKGHVEGDFKLLEREIKNGVLTHATLTVLKRYSSSQEWHELCKTTKIKAAMVYPRSLMIEYEGHQSFAKWEESLRSEAHQRRITTLCEMARDGPRMLIEDRRPGPWIKFPLSRFIEPLIDNRKSLKRKMNAADKYSDAYNALNAKQLAIKGVVNTLYGILASPYFDTSSPCAANNITATARTACFLMTTACGGFKSITDGCEFNLNKVRFWISKRPSLNTMANMPKPSLIRKTTRKGIKEAPLGSNGDPKCRWDRVIKDGQYFLRFKGTDGMCTEYTLKEAQDYIERIYREHVLEFFSVKDNPTQYTLRPSKDRGVAASKLSDKGLTHVNTLPLASPDISRGFGAAESAKMSTTTLSAQQPLRSTKGLPYSPDSPKGRGLLHMDMGWFERFGIECKVLGYGYAAHGMANYIIGSLSPGKPHLIKARGHKLNAVHYNANTGESVESPMKTFLTDLFDNRALRIPPRAVYFKPCSVGEYKKRRVFREQGILPGDSIPRSASVKMITLSEFHFRTEASMRTWEHHYKYIVRHYDKGLEAGYLDTQGCCNDITSVKVDIQSRIFNNDKPKRVLRLRG